MFLRSITPVRRPSLIILVIAGAVAILPPLLGVPQGDDWFIELVRVQEYQRAWAGGDILPTWAPEVLSGFGGRDFLFFPPLFAAVAAGLASITSTIGSGVILALTGVTLISLATMHRAAASLGRLLELPSPDTVADIAAAAYGLAPFIVFDRLVRNSFAELTALAILPLGVWAVAESRARSLRAAVLAALTVAGVVLSHLLTVAIGAIAILVTWALIRPSRTDWRPVAAGSIAGLSVTAWFWIPLLSAVDTVRTEELTGYGLAADDNLLSIGEQLWPGDVALGPGMVILALATLLLARRAANRDVQRLAVAGGVIALLLVVLTSPAGASLWELEGLTAVQFPWRLWSVHGVVGSLALGAAASRMASSTGPRMAIVGIIVVSAAVPMSRLATVNGSWTGEVEDLLAANDLPYQSTIGFEYLPAAAGLGVWQSHDPNDGPVLDTVGGRVTSIQDEPYRLELTIESSEPAGVVMALWDVPEWTVDGATTRFPGDAGTLGFGVGSGTTTVVIEYQAPPLRRTLERLTPLVLAFWMAVAFWFSRRSMPREEPA